MERLSDLALRQLWPDPWAKCGCRGHVVLELAAGEAEPAGPIRCPDCGRPAVRVYVLRPDSGFPPIAEEDLAEIAAEPVGPWD